MKRLAIVLLVVLLVLGAVMFGPRLLRMVGADLGGFTGAGDYGGGGDFGGGSSWSSSDWGGGSSWSGGSTWTSGSDDDGHGFFYFPIGVFNDGSESPGGYGGFLVWAILILFILIYLSRAKAHSTVTQNAGAAAGAQRTPDSKLTPISEYAALDPNFSAADMREKLANIYVQMQNGCTARNIEALRPYFTDVLYQQFDRQIKALIANRQINYVDRISVLDVNLRGFFQEGNEDHLVAELKTRVTDYTVNEDTGNLVSGSKTAEKFMTYEWDLSRPTGTATEQAGQTTERHCPNCGAPLSVNESAKCPYCDSVITFADHDWTIYAVKGIAQRTVQA